MKCSRCAAELPDTSTFCSSCGTANPSVQVATSSFSYLPAGAPPWPASTPTRSPYANGSMAPVQASPSKSADKSRSSPGKIMSSILILLIPLVIGVGGTLGVLFSQGRFSSATAAPKKVVVAQVQATPAATTASQGTQLPTPTSFKSATAKDVNVALEYPSTWVQDALQKTTDGTSLAIHPPQEQQIIVGFSITRYMDTYSATLSSADQINQEIALGFGQQNSLTNQQTMASTGNLPSMGGAVWTKLETSYLTSGSNKIDLMTASVLHNKDYYSIYVYAPDAYYPEAMQKYIQHMFTSFKFLS
jgi:zinc-ribbon domain